MKVDVEERKALARELHRSGYNCCQSVFMAYSDVVGIDEDIVSKISLPFGGGMGGMRGVCGCVSAAFMLTGFIAGDKRGNYALVQQLARDFESLNGSIVCRELLQSGKKPCSEYVEIAASLIGEKINSSL
ncbi:MAG: C-GCAxxG-C-C family protein [Candidatus Limimorpha sp.]